MYRYPSRQPSLTSSGWQDNKCSSEPPSVCAVVFVYLLFDHHETLHLHEGGLQCGAGLDQAGVHRLQGATQLLLLQRHRQQLVDL